MRLKKIEKAGKGFLMRLLKTVLGSKQTPPFEEDLQNIKKILIVRVDDRIGNLVMLTPFVKTVKQAFQAAKVTLLVGAKFSKLLGNNPYIDSLIVADKLRFIKNPFKYLSFLRGLSKVGFDLVFDASHVHSFSFQSGLYSYFTKAPYRVGFKRENSELFLNIQVPSRMEREGYSHHESRIYLELLEHLGKEVMVSLPEIRLTSEEIKEARQLLAEIVPPNSIKIGIHTGGRRGKVWDFENFAQLADLLSNESRVTPLIFCGKNEIDKMDHFITHAKHPHYIVPVLPIRKFAAILQNLDLFISVDTGPMHLAVAVGTPTIEIFFKKDHLRYGYSMEGKHKVINIARDELKPTIIWQECNKILDLKESNIQ